MNLQSAATGLRLGQSFGGGLRLGQGTGLILGQTDLRLASPAVERKSVHK